MPEPYIQGLSWRVGGNKTETRDNTRSGHTRCAHYLTIFFFSNHRLIDRCTVRRVDLASCRFPFCFNNEGHRRDMMAGRVGCHVHPPILVRFSLNYIIFDTDYYSSMCLTHWNARKCRLTASILFLACWHPPWPTTIPTPILTCKMQWSSSHCFLSTLEGDDKGGQWAVMSILWKGLLICTILSTY